jgi:hypothetical protein
MKVEYRLRPEELREAQWGMMGLGWMTPGRWLALFALCAAFIVGFLLIRAWLNPAAPQTAPAASEDLSPSHLAPAIPWVVGAGLVLFVVLRNVRKARSDPAYDRVNSFAADENGLVIIDGVSRVEHSWSAIVKYRETTSLFLLYVNSSVAVPVPKRAFSAAELAEFRKLLRRGQGDRGGGRSGASDRDAPSRSGFEPLEGREHI